MNHYQQTGGAGLVQKFLGGDARCEGHVSPKPS